MLKIPAIVVVAALGLVACSTPESMEAEGTARQPPPPVAPVTEAPHYVFGFSSPFGAEVGMQRARLVTNHLSHVLDRKVEPRLYDYDQLADALVNGTVDFAFMPPVAYVKAVQKSSGLNLLRQAEHNGALSYRAVFFVRADSSIHSMDDAQGSRLAWIDGDSASGRMFPQYYFLQHSIVPEKYFKDQLSLADHSRVCKAVYDGTADVGTSFTDANTEDELVDGCKATLGEKAKELRIIVMSDPIPNDVVVARAGLSQDVLDSFGGELDRLMATDEGLEVLNNGFQAEAFFAVNDPSFNPLRQMVGIPARFPALLTTPGTASAPAPAIAMAAPVVAVAAVAPPAVIAPVFGIPVGSKNP